MSAQIIKLVKRARRKKKPKLLFPFYDICVVDKAEGGSRVLEKLGFWSTGTGIIKINIFRLSYWVAKEVTFTGNSLRCLELASVISL